MKMILCPHCGEVIRIDSDVCELTDSPLDRFCVEYDPKKEAVKNHFAHKVENIDFPDLARLNLSSGFAGKEICFTGFTESDKEKLRELSAKLGISMRNTVTKNLDFLVCGPNAGPAKIRKCEEQKIKIAGIDEFFRSIAPEDEA